MVYRREFWQRSPQPNCRAQANLRQTVRADSSAKSDQRFPAQAHSAEFCASTRSNLPMSNSAQFVSCTSFFNQRWTKLMGTSTSLGNEQEQARPVSLPRGVSVPAGRPDFIRVPFSKGGHIHIESCCIRCNFRILAWLGNFDEQEQQHALECRGLRAD